MTRDDFAAPELGATEVITCWQRLGADDRRLVARIAPDLAAALEAAIEPTNIARDPAP